MLNYQDYQEAVYHWFLEKNKKDPSFTFSTRVKGSKGAELNYFIGTEKSGYFGTTFWMIPVGFPGSSSDLIDVFFGYSDKGMKYFIEFNQTKTPDPGQNTWALDFLKSMKDPIQSVLPLLYESADKNKMYAYKIAPVHPEYTDIKQLLTDLDNQLKVLIPIVDKALTDQKKKNPEFVGHRFTNDEFQNFQRRLIQRKERFKDIEKDEYHNNFQTVLDSFDEDDLDTYFSFMSELVVNYNLKAGDKRLVFNYSKSQLSLTISQRHSWVLKANKQEKFGVLSLDQLNEKSVQFDGNHPRTWLTYFETFRPSESEKQNILAGIELELNRSEQSGFRTYNKSDFEAYVFKTPVTRSDLSEDLSARNIILYGPPGTGKTFTLKTKYFPLYTTKETALSKEKHFEEVVRELTWWQVIALTMIEIGTNRVNDILSNRWVEVKAKMSESKNVRATIWGTLQMHTIQESTTVSYSQRQAPLIFNKQDDKRWVIIEAEVKENCPELYDILNSVNNFNPNPDREIKRYVFTTFHQSFNYEDFIEGIKPVLSDDNENSEVAYRIEDGIFKALCKRAESDPENRYAIFIDEINRGNVSNIFGELITLIETDKRKGAEHAMSAILPYSKKQFAVPSNVDIYGTMNTADRSVEALDTALRRRFSFTEMLPQPELIQTTGPLKSTNGILDGIDLALLLKTINKRIEKLLDKDHQIGHSYFLKVDSLDSLKSAFHNAIIPLLQEYFFGDYGKIGLVLGQGFFEELESSEDEKFFAGFKEYEIDGILDKRVYHIKDVTQMDDNAFIEIVKAILPRT